MSALFHLCESILPGMSGQNDQDDITVPVIRRRLHICSSPLPGDSVQFQKTFLGQRFFCGKIHGLVGVNICHLGFLDQKVLLIMGSEDCFGCEWRFYSLCFDIVVGLIRSQDAFQRFPGSKCLL